MSDEKQYTETDLVKAKRQAFRDGAVHAARTHGCGRPECADERYPLPKITRLRVVKDEMGVEWRLFDGALQVRASGDSRWSIQLALHSGRASLIADLLANPTEEVEAES